MTKLPMSSRKHRAFTLLEVAISVAIISLGVAATMSVVSLVAAQRQDATDRAIATGLADAMVSELQSVDWGSEGVIYSIPTDSAPADRTGFDDLDDYHYWIGSPPIERDGTAIPEAAGMQRLVLVTWADTQSGLNSSAPTGVKVVIVVVHRNGTIAATRKFARSNTGASLFAESWPGDLVASRTLGVGDPGNTGDGGGTTFRSTLEAGVDTSDARADTKLSIYDESLISEIPN
ncbi:MAG: prepilin-type N-terminal cleavage/methylation domain-containing protein [Planctomycetota bacterium]